jgi:hypothetical protein
MFLLVLAACSSTPEPFTPTVDQTWSAKTAESLCTVLETTQRPCALEGSTATIGDKALTFRVTVESEGESYGIVTLKGYASVLMNGAEVRALRTPVRAFGGNLAEAYERSVHEWAVVYGVAMADWAVGDPSRPSLAAVDKANHSSPIAAYGAGTLYRGWPLVRGSKQPLDHEPIVSVLGPILEGFSGGPHAVVLEVDVNGEGTHQVFWVDGAPSPALDAAVAATRFAGEPGLQIRQYYLWSE